MTRHALIGITVTLFSLSGTVVAQGPAAQFSAEALQTAPDRPARSARMYVGADRVRMEYEQRGQRVAELVDWKQGRAVLLLLDQGTYMEQSAPAEVLGAARGRGGDAGQSTENNPCQGVPGAQCRHLGQELVAGRTADKWEMLVQHEGTSERSLHWIDAQKHMPLRQFWPDGTVTELKLLGSEMLHGRQVEKWQQVTIQPGGQAGGKSVQATQWYDPQLQIAVREELPGGYLRELRDIRIAEQPAALFEIPAGFRRVDIPVSR